MILKQRLLANTTLNSFELHTGVCDRNVRSFWMLLVSSCQRFKESWYPQIPMSSSTKRFKLKWLIPKMKALWAFEKLVNIYQPTSPNVPQDLNIQQNLCRNHKSQMRLWVYALDFEGLQEYCHATFLFRHSIPEAPFSNLGGDYPGWNFWLTFCSPSRQIPRQYLYYTTAASLQSPSNSSFINRFKIWDTESVVKYRTLNSVTGLDKRCNQCLRI